MTKSDLTKAIKIKMADNLNFLAVSNNNEVLFVNFDNYLYNYYLQLFLEEPRSPKLHPRYIFLRRIKRQSALVYIHIHIYIYIYVYICIYIYMYSIDMVLVYIYIHICTNKFIYIYIHIYIYT